MSTQGTETQGSEQKVGTVVIGAGQAGLVMGYRLQCADEDFVVLEAAPRVGDSWRRRYDSLRLFSLPRYASLPGWRIPVRGFPTRDEMADYLEEYARRFEIPVRTGEPVRRVTREGEGFRVETDAGAYLADKVVVTTGAHAVPIVPALAADLDPAVRQIHSLDYRGPDQLAPGGVLVVGAGNSGTDVALEAADAGHRTWLAGRHPGQVPFDIDGVAGRVMTPIVMFVFRRVLTRRTPMGRRFMAKAEGHGVMLVRNKLADLEDAGVVQIDRIESVVGGRAVSCDDEVPDVSTVVWCTGSRPDHRFLDAPGAFGDDGEALHDRGVSSVPGLSFLGLELQYAVSSTMIQGVDRDARHLLRRMRAAQPARRDSRDVAPEPVAPVTGA
ncbi:flavin-containing monooxygenase [Mumia zhuanghuii]|uniref:flavin-containing monooxygenase n=1 Tax=Mumia zhuanghuii TaxID=2585211 RepID=UPI0036449700